MTHQEAYDLLESYTLGTLEAAEYDLVEAHLDAGCDECNARLHALGGLTVLMAHAVPQYDAPPDIRKKVFRHVHDASALASARPRRLLGTGWMAAAVAILAFVILAWWTSDLKRGVGELVADLNDARRELALLENDVAAQREAREMLGKPCTRLIDLAGVDPNPECYGKAILHPDIRSAVMFLYRMPKTPEGMTYQLWAVRDGVPRSMGVFTIPKDGGDAIIKLPSLPDPTTIASFSVTIEPTGGVPEPTGMRYLIGDNSLYGHEHMEE